MSTEINQVNSQGKRHGYWELYHDNGKVLEACYYTNGVLDGLSQGFFSDGNTLHKGLYKNGKKTGYWEYYHKMNVLLCKVCYVDGKNVGLLEWYDEEGNLDKIEYYAN